MTKVDYEEIYRKLNPKANLYSPWKRQRELKDLWPEQQEAFKIKVDTILDTFYNDR